MLIEVKVENLKEDALEAKVTKIYKAPGDEVKAGDKLVDLEVKKANMPVESKANGSIVSLPIKAGQMVKNGELLMTIEGEVPQVTAEPKKEFSYFSSMAKPQKREIECDVAILGGGPGGYVAAIKAAQAGRKVALVEKEKVGGTCLHWGCIPTKCLVRSAEVYETIQEADQFGCVVGKVTLNMNRVMERKNQVVQELYQGIEYLLDQNKIELIQGIGTFEDEHTVSVKKGSQEIIIKASYIIIATGSKNAQPSILGATLPQVIDSNIALQMEGLPDSMAIIGGGVIGMEFASIYASFGVNVSIIEFQERLLTGCDHEVCQEISGIMRERGIKLYMKSRVEAILPAENGQCILAFTQGGEMKYLSADKVFMAVGREPLLDDLGLDKISIELNDNKRGIKVNDQMQTNIKHIYAIGDVTNQFLLAHVASHQATVACQNILGETARMDYHAVPSAIFTRPEIAMVGLTEEAALAEGLDISVGKFYFTGNGKALSLGESRGFIKIVIDKKTEKILGGSIIGSHASDLITDITLAVRNGLTASQIAETIYAHPTTAEVVHEAALSAKGTPLHGTE